MFAFGNAYMDLPSLGALPKYTGGQLYYYPGFVAERDAPKLRAELRCGGRRQGERDACWLAEAWGRCLLGWLAGWLNGWLNGSSV